MSIFEKMKQKRAKSEPVPSEKSARIFVDKELLNQKANKTYPG